MGGATEVELSEIGDEIQVGLSGIVGDEGAEADVFVESAEDQQPQRLGEVIPCGLVGEMAVGLLAKLRRFDPVGTDKCFDRSEAV